MTLDNDFVVNLKFTVTEVNALLSLLGELPTKTGAWPFSNSIQQQAQYQVNEASNPKVDGAEVKDNTG